MKNFNYCLKFVRIFVCLSLMISCVNEDVLPTMDDSTVTWEVTLSDILTDNSCILDSNDLRLVNFEPIVRIYDTSEEFFSDDNSYIPVFYRSGTSFYITHIDSLANDTTRHTNEKISYIKNTVSNIIEMNTELDVVKLYWKKGDNFFSSIALFNSVSGELIYDNILINMPLVDIKVQTKGGFINTRIVSAEYEPYVNADNNISVSFSVDGVVVATASASWQAYGEWRYIDTPIPEYNCYVRQYVYYHDRVDTQTSTWVKYDKRHLYQAVSYCKELKPTGSSTTTGNNKFSVRYALFAGSLSVTFAQENYPGGGHTDSNSTFSVHVDEVHESPYKDYEVYASNFYSLINDVH